MATTTRHCRCMDKTIHPAKYGKLEPELCLELKKIVKKLTAPGKGIVDVEETIEPSNTNTVIHQILTPEEKWCECIGGVVLQHDSVFNQTANDTKTIPDYLVDMNIVPGVQVDKGTVPLFGTFNETTTQGLDNLQDECIIYKKYNCHFTRWRCVFKVSEIWPTRLAVIDNANVAARYASITQSARMVPVIQLDVKHNGDYSINRAEEVHETILSQLFHALFEHHVFLPGLILIPTMIRPGVKNVVHLEPHMIAESTLNILRNVIPPSIPAIMFINCNQSPPDFIINLNAIVCNDERKPWTVSFCFTMTNNINDEQSEYDENKIATTDELLPLTMKNLAWCRDACQGGPININEIREFFKKL